MRAALVGIWQKRESALWSTTPAMLMDKREPLGTSEVHLIVIDRSRAAGAGRHVRVEPDPCDGTRCEGIFADAEKAAQFASQLRRARGWAIVNRADQPQAARQALDE
jgi:hypothetical protein